jgi:YihY family inner membrane protein
VNVIERTTRRVDGFQQRHTVLAFPFAVVKKFGDDQAGMYASLIAYYGFFSLFPLLMVFTTVLGFVLQGNEEAQQTILDSALAQFPVIGDQISKNVHSITGSGLTLVVGVLLTLWGGLGVMNAMQTGMNRVWDVPLRDRPNFWKSRVRALIMLVLLGTAAVASAIIAGISAAGASAGLTVTGGYALSLALNLGVFLLSFRILTARKLSWGDVFPGACVAAVAWLLLQILGGYIVGHQLQSASQVYGVFAIVIGLLAWMALGAQVTLYAAEVNVVRKERLWPRSLVQPPLSEADQKAYRRAAIQEERRPEESVKVRFDEESPAEAEHADRSERERVRDVEERDASAGS